MHFQNLSWINNKLSFDIADSTSKKPLVCTLSPGENGLLVKDDILLDVQFYKDTPDKVPPFNDVAGIKFFLPDGTFLFWLTPQKFIHHILTKRLKGAMEGPVGNFIDYHIHYIGKSFAQDIWNRLTGHEKLQSILTMEAPNAPLNKNSQEISLILLDIVGFNDINMFPYFKPLEPQEPSAIIHEFDFDPDSQSFEEYYAPKIGLKSIELTNEVEAALVRKFLPDYNTIHFKKYPEIESGTRSLGYTESIIAIESLPATLSTKTFTQKAFI
jgi:hypothetical protein